MANTYSVGRRTITIVPDGPIDIQGISRAAAAVVTWASHGLVTGQRVSFSGITQADWTVLNSNSYPITWLSANTFSIPVNTSGIAVAYNAGTDPGTIGSDFDITTMLNGHIPVGTVTGIFVAGEIVTQATSGATGVVLRWDQVQNILHLVSVTGFFDTTHTVTGGTSGATAIPIEVSVAFPGGIRLSKVDFGASQAGDTLIIRERAAYGPVIFARHRDTSNSGFHRPVGGRSLRVNPYIFAAEQDWGTPANVQIVLEYD